MRIAGAASRPPTAHDVPAALSGAVALLGQRPAISAPGTDLRREQGFASLAGWVAKGANLLQLELGVGPGDRVGLAGPAGWPLAAVALSAWWVGASIVPALAPPGGGAGDGAGDGAPSLAVLHTAAAMDRPLTTDVECFWFGDALDGTGTPGSTGEQWTDAVTPHGDRPPRPAQGHDLVALSTSSGDLLQHELLALLTGDEGGVLGIVRDDDGDIVARPDAASLLAALALRPLVTGSATVIVADDADRDANARAERIVRWYA
jgi:hypothetical protein